MYYPYLRGKQFELLALRELAQNKATWNIEKICPILEPLKDEESSLFKAIDSMQNALLPFALILNPYRGDFFADKGDFAGRVLSHLSSSKSPFKITTPPTWIPAFLIDQNVELALRIIEELPKKNIMLIAQEDIDIEKIQEALESGKIKYFVLPESKSAIRKIKRISKKIELIRLDNNFPAVKRNSDYQNKEDQPFSEEFAFYEEDGFSGFSDYTLITKEIADGGALPMVVAIHLSYSKSNEEIRVHHFLSESNSNGRENIQKKFAEAVEKVEDFFKNSKEKTSPIESLIQLKNDGHYPGLGSLKKFSIEHHILLIDSLLKGTGK